MRKIVVYDYSDVAKELLPRLKAGIGEIVLVSKDRANFEAALVDGFSPVLMDLSIDANLTKIGVGESVTDFFCICDCDDANLYTTLSVRALSESVNILARASDSDSKKKLTLAGANEIIDFNEIGANIIFQLLKRETTLKFLDSVLYNDISKLSLLGIELCEIEVVQGSEADQKTLFELDLKHNYNLIALGALDNQISKRFIFNVNSFNHKIDAGDIIVVMGTRSDISRFAAKCGVTL